MNRHMLIVLAVLMLPQIPVNAIASSDHKHASHGEQQVMQADGAAIVVGSQISKGVKGTARIRAVSVEMSELDVKITHHFMMDFIDVESGEPVSRGEVVLKVTNPDAKISEPVALLGMDGHFGVDLFLDMKGEYHFRMDTRLDDGTKRKFHFHYVNK